MKYQNFLIALTIVAIVASVFSSTFSTTSSYTTPHNLNVWTSAVEAEVIRTDGSTENLYMGPNNITNTGLNWTRDFLAYSGRSSGQAATIVLGNGSTAEDVTITTLSNQFNATSCGLTPQLGTVASVTATGTQNSGNYSTTYQWTVSGCSGGNIIVNTTALYNNSAPGNSCGAGCIMFAGKNFSAPVTLQNGDQLNVTWYVWAASGG